MKYLVFILLSFFVITTYAMDNDYKKAVLNMKQFTQLYMNNSLKAEEFKNSMASLNYLNLIAHEKAYVQGQADLEKANINILPEPMQEGIKQSKKWCNYVLPIIQTIKQEKIKNYLLYGGGIAAFCIACCTLCYWLDHNKDSERQLIQWQIEY